MRKDEDTLRQLASLLGVTSVGLGALGAHAFHDKLVQRKMLDAWRTAILYQLFHATAVLGVSALCSAQDEGSSSKLALAGKVMAYGSVLFSGSIYMLCFNIGPKRLLGPMTPIGGFLMVGGWVMLGLN